MKTSVNLDTINGLKNLGDPDLFERLVEVFSTTGEKAVTNINQFSAQKDWQKVEFEAHSLKSSAVSLGADELGDACLALENMSKGGSTKQVASLVEKIPALFESSLKELKKLCD